MILHYTDNYLLNPPHRVTINLVGLGGTGSMMLTALVKINETLKALGHPGLHVSTWDPDFVTTANLGRQMFSEADLGRNKAIVLASRVNRAFGLDWEAHNKEYKHQQAANILVTCIDTAAGRLAIAGGIKNTSGGSAHRKAFYWLDIGNLQKTGQVVLGTVRAIPQPKTDKRTASGLANVIKMFPQLKKIKEKDQGPSCSLAEAIKKQDLFINPTLAQFAGCLIWKLFREGVIHHHGCYVNLDTFQVNPIPIR